MAIEKRWSAIAPRVFVANGSSIGKITVASTRKFKTKQEITVTATGEDSLPLEIKRVLSKTELIVGPRKTPLDQFTDLSAYTTAKSAAISALEQYRPSIPAQEHERAVYEEEPVVAKRIYLVDDIGESFNEDNPLPVLATISDNAPTTVYVYRVPYPTADVEMSQIIPDNTKKIRIALENLDGRLRVSYATNGTIDAGGNDYITTHVGNSYMRETVKLINKTVYFQTNKSDVIIEIECWV